MQECCTRFLTSKMCINVMWYTLLGSYHSAQNKAHNIHRKSNLFYFTCCCCCSKFNPQQPKVSNSIIPFKGKGVCRGSNTVEDGKALDVRGLTLKFTQVITMKFVNPTS
uniref:Uncharacterized protein n=1 Tax=Rhizophora mucronata TaxID=61149 RepID=A0A2P2LK01_RHIMU